MKPSPDSAPESMKSSRRSQSDQLRQQEALDESGAVAPSHEQDFQDYDYSNFYFGVGQDAFDMLTPFDDWWRWARPEGYYLFGQPMSSAPGTRVDVRETKGGEILRGLINLASYNYLGLSYRQEVIDAAVEALKTYGLGASGSPILSGYFDLHENLRLELARFKGKEDVLLFPTGYSANLGLISGLMRPGDLVIADQYAHASIVDGIILSKAKPLFFRHNDANDLERKLKRFDGKKLVVVEGVYSMDGDLANLPDIVEVCQRHGARILIDEAHSSFLFGPTGRGVAEHFGLDDQVDIHVGTFSKTLGGVGGFVAGSTKLINYLRGFARSRVFSCAMPPAVAAGLLRSLQIVEDEPELRHQLHENVAFMQKRLRDAGVDIGNSASQVIPVFVRDDKRIFSIVEQLNHEGVYLNPVRYPAVGKHRSRVRISLSAAHRRPDLEEGADILIRVLRRNGLCP